MFQTVSTKNALFKDKSLKILILTMTLTLTLSGRGGGQPERNCFVDGRKRRHTSVQSVGTSHLGPIRTARGLEY